MIISNPQFFYFFIFIVFFLFFIIINYYKNSKNINLLLGSKELSQKFFMKFLIILIINLLALLFLIFALVGFSWKKDYVVNNMQKSDVALVIDVSKSMLADDIYPNRLIKTISVAQSILVDIPDVRYQLSIFKGDSEILIPWTEDIESIRIAISSISVDSMSSVGTDCNLAIKKTLESFINQRESTKNIFLFSDGGENILDLNYIIKVANSKNIVINSVTVGNKEPIYLKDKQGEYILYDGKKINVQVNDFDLVELAKRTKGVNYDIKDVLLVSAIRKKIVETTNQLNIQSFSEKRVDNYQIFLFISILLFFLNILVKGFLWRKNI